MIEYQPLESEKYLLGSGERSQAPGKRSVRTGSTARLLTLTLFLAGIGLGYLAGASLLEDVDLLGVLRRTASRLPFIGN